MPITQALLKQIRKDLSAVYVEMRRYEETLPRGAHHPGLTHMETHLAIVDGRFRATVHGQTMPLWQFQEMPHVVYPAFHLLRLKLEQGTKK